MARRHPNDSMRRSLLAATTTGREDTDEANSEHDSAIVSAQAVAGLGEALVRPDYIRRANIDNIEAVARLVNQNAYSEERTTRRANVAGALWMMFCSCCCASRNYRNTPNEVQMILAANGQVIADMSRRNCISDYLESSLGKLSLQSDQDYWQFSNVHVVRVRAGRYARVVLDNRPLLLESGIHAYIADQFRYVDDVAVSDEVIQHSTIHMLRVPQGRLAKVVLDGNNFRLLGQGMHAYNSAQMVYSGMVNTTDAVIKHGNIHRFNASPGTAVVINDMAGEGSIAVLLSGQRTVQSENIRHLVLNMGSHQVRVQEEIVTSDSFKISVKGFIEYHIEDPEKLVNRLGFGDDIDRLMQLRVGQFVNAAFNDAASRAAYKSVVEHSLASSDTDGEHEQLSAKPAVSMTSAAKADDEQAVTDSVKAQVNMHVFKHLRDDLNKMGLVCDSVNFTQFLPDAETCRRMEQANKRVLDARADLAATVLEQRKRTQEAEGDAARSTIQAEAAAKQKSIEASGDAKARGIHVSAEVNATKDLADAKASAYAAEAAARNEALEREAKVYEDNPRFAQVKATTETASSLAQAGSVTLFMGPGKHTLPVGLGLQPTLSVTEHGDASEQNGFPMKR